MLKKIIQVMWDSKYTKPFIDLFINNERKVDLNNINSNFIIRFGNEKYSDGISFSESLQNILENDENINKYLIDYMNIIKLCFSSFPKESAVSFRGKQATGIDPSSMFYSNISYREDIKSTLTHVNKETMKDYISQKQQTNGNILLDITRKLVNNNDTKQNYLFLVEGEIGSGKTTFLTKLMIEAVMASNTNNVVIINIDFENHMNEFIKCLVPPTYNSDYL
jgi:chromosomal replication initiation ATPase DnaA